MSFRTMYSETEIIVSPAGEKVYKYIYQNSDGKLVEEQRNMYELIQSSRESVNFKRSIAEYGLDNDALQQNRGGLYVDTTQFRDDYTDFVKRLQSVIDSSKTAYEQAVSRKGSSEIGNASSKASNKAVEKASEIK